MSAVYSNQSINQSILSINRCPEELLLLHEVYFSCAEWVATLLLVKKHALAKYVDDDTTES